MYGKQATCDFDSLRGRACPFDKYNHLVLARVECYSVPSPLNGGNNKKTPWGRLKKTKQKKKPIFFTTFLACRNASIMQ